MSMYVLLGMGVLQLGGQKKLLRGLSFYSTPFPLRQDLSLSICGSYFLS